MAFKDPEKSREYKRQWQTENPEKARAYGRKWRAANLEKARETTRKFQTEHPEKALESARKWRVANPEKHRVAVHKWFSKNPEKNAEYVGNRRAHKSKTYVDLTATEIAEIKQAGCFFKDDTCSGPLTIAHDNPVANKGNTTRGNCFCLCRYHNSQMHTKTLAQKIKQLLFPF